MTERPELFLLSWEVIDACFGINKAGIAEINATYEDMEKLGIAEMPYPMVDLGVPLALNVPHQNLPKGKTFPYTVLFEKPSKDNQDSIVETRFRFRGNECYSLLMKQPHSTEWLDFTSQLTCNCPACQRSWITIPELAEEQTKKHAAEKFRRALVVLLATKNIVKTRNKDKLAALGIGKIKKSNYHPVYTTTLTLPAELKEVADQVHAHTGVKLRPHLRRGHVTHQRHGPRNQYVKLIWIQPCFVNADENYVPKRVNYNVSMKCEGVE